FDLDDDWLDTALPELLGKIGAPALDPIHAYLADRTRWVYGQAEACRALEKIAEQHPELHERVVAIFSEILRDAEHYDEVVNTAAMGGLVELGRSRRCRSSGALSSWAGSTRWCTARGAMCSTI